MKHKQLIDHVSRLEGQLAAVKAELQKSTPDCKKASRTLAASSRSFASLRLAFVRCFLSERGIPQTHTKEDAELEALFSVIKS